MLQRLNVTLKSSVFAGCVNSPASASGCQRVRPSNTRPPTGSVRSLQSGQEYQGKQESQALRALIGSAALAMSFLVRLWKIAASLPIS